MVSGPEAPVTSWWDRRQALSQARFEVSLAVLQARKQLASYEAKADIEWDMKWASQVGRSGPATAIIASTMAVPVVAWFLPWTHELAKEGLDLFTRLDPNAPLYFAYGWIIMFATVFGIGQLKNMVMPGRLAGLVSAIGKAPSDVPEEAIADSGAVKADEVP